jgi:tripartite-type tricarboxylate transporter receptor subunit TctC
VEGQIALLGDHIYFGAGDFNYSLVESGQIKVLLISKDERSEEYPQVPIPKDLGYNVPCPMLNIVTAPKDLPEGIAKKLENAFTKGMKDPDFIKGMKNLRYPIVYRSSKELTDYVTKNYESMQKTLKEIGLTK